MTTREGLSKVPIPDWMFKAILSILGFMLIYMLNQKSGDIDKLNKKLDMIMEQNAEMKSDLKLSNSKISDFDNKFGELESRVRELELKDARRE